MARSTRRVVKPTEVKEDALAYFTPETGKSTALRALTALDQMYGYYTRD